MQNATALKLLGQIPFCQQCCKAVLRGKPSCETSLLLLQSSQNASASAENDYHDNCRAQWEVQTVTHCPGLGGSKSW